MTTTVRKWGNSTSVRIPVPALRVAGLTLDAEVAGRAEAERIVIEPARRRAYGLDELVQQILLKAVPCNLFTVPRRFRLVRVCPCGRERYL